MFIKSIPNLHLTAKIFVSSYHCRQFSYEYVSALSFDPFSSVQIVARSVVPFRLVFDRWYRIRIVHYNRPVVVPLTVKLFSRFSLFCGVLRVLSFWTWIFSRVKMGRVLLVARVELRIHSTPQMRPTFSSTSLAFLHFWKIFCCRLSFEGSASVNCEHFESVNSFLLVFDVGMSPRRFFFIQERFNAVLSVQ